MTRATPARLFTIGLILALPAAALAQDNPKALNTGKAPFKGVWETTVRVNGAPLELVGVNATDDSFANYIKGSPQPFAQGRMEAADGKFKTTATLGESDQGTYQFIDANTVVMKGKAAVPVTWRRVQVPGKGTVKVTDLIGRARGMAKAWRDDARMVEVQVRAPAMDGTLDFTVQGASIMCHFLSPRNEEGFTVSSAMGGQLFPSAQAGKASPHTLGIPEGAIDLSLAIERAHQAGFQGRADRAELAMYDLLGTKKPARLAWVLFPEPHGASRNADPVCVSAASGALIEFHQVHTDAKAYYNELAAQAQASMQRMIQASIPQQRGGAPGWIQQGFNFWSSGPGYHPSAPNNANGNDEARQMRDQWNRDVALQNAWDHDDMRAYDRISTGSASDEDRSSYGSGY